MKKTTILGVAGLGLTVILSACGSSGGGDGAVANPVVADGYLRGATVFVDLDGDKARGTSEPWGVTGPGGVTAWNEAPSHAQLANNPVVVQVTADTIDEDNELPVGKSYMLSAPAGLEAFISPITTLVQQQMERYGMNLATAEAEVKVALQMGNDDLFADYIASGDSRSHRLAQVMADDMGRTIDTLSQIVDTQGGDSTLMELAHETLMGNLSGFVAALDGADLENFDPMADHGRNPVVMTGLFDRFEQAAPARPQAWLDNCAGCHGADNQGISDDGPSLKAPLHSDEIREGIAGAMPAFAEADLSTADLDSIKAWIASQPPAKPEAWTLSCAGCHGQNNEGIAGDGPALKAPLHEDEIRQGIAGSDMPAFPAADLSDHALEDIEAWIANLPNVVPAAWSANCASCHGANNEGIVGDGPALRQLHADEVRAGVGAMPAFSEGALSDADLSAIGGWIAARAVAPATWTTNCAGCHGASNEGIVGDGSALDAHTMSWMAVRMGIGDHMPGFSPSQLSHDELTSITEWISMQPEGPAEDGHAGEEEPHVEEPPVAGSALDGQALFVANCGTCHSSQGFGMGGMLLSGGRTLAQIQEAEMTRGLSTEELQVISEFLGH